ncbi:MULTISPECIES: hypothetical protein [Pseudomonas]|jgi:hypothetical protein|uniref:hypothetical protein n=1 Tax=Pseudomonas sp. NY5710 TaxID=2662033 RepID=UPI0015704487|nr:hypothetical protein [Pseudomonas sp. NY5710]
MSSDIAMLQGQSTLRSLQNAFARQKPWPYSRAGMTGKTGEGKKQKAHSIIE